MWHTIYFAVARNTITYFFMLMSVSQIAAKEILSFTSNTKKMKPIRWPSGRERLLLDR